MKLIELQQLYAQRSDAKIQILRRFLLKLNTLLNTLTVNYSTCKFEQNLQHSSYWDFREFHQWTKVFNIEKSQLAI